MICRQYPRKKFSITQRLLLLSCLAAADWCPPGAIAGEGLRSPFVEARDADPIQWIAWDAAAAGTIREADRPALVFVAHELNPLAQAMARESFANAEMAKRINGSFTPVLVDKNQYPGVAAYFSALVSHAKQVKGWPVTVFVTPELGYIDGGGYFSAADNWGNPGLSTVIGTVAQQWETQREVVVARGKSAVEELAAYYGEDSRPATAFAPAHVSLAVRNLAEQFDFERGGFSAAPKAVRFDLLELLAVEIERDGTEAETALRMTDAMLEAVLRGAVRDWVHGGFFSAATDEEWRTPDFRKTLDVQVQAIGYLARDDGRADLVREVADALVREFRNEAGTFSEVIERRLRDEAGEKGRSGRVHAWSFDELREALGDEAAARLAEVFAIEAEGNVPVEKDPGNVFGGRNLLFPREGALKGGHIDAELRRSLDRLRDASEARSTVVREKVSSVSTNARAILALVEAGRVAGERYFEYASAAAGTVWKIYWQPEAGRLAAAAVADKVLPGEASAHGYAVLAAAMTALADATGESVYREQAARLYAVLRERFASDAGPVFETAVDDASTPLRLYAFREDGNGSANACLLSIAAAGPGPELPGRDVADRILAHLPEDIEFSPEAFPALLVAAARVAGGE